MTNKQYEEKEMDSYKYWHISQMNNSYPYKQKPIYLFIDLIEREKKETHGEFYDSIKKIKLQLTYIYSKRNSRSSRVWKLHKIEKTIWKQLHHKSTICIFIWTMSQWWNLWHNYDIFDTMVLFSALLLVF